MRELDLDKPPGMAETIDWVSALAALGAAELVPQDVVRSLSALAKTPDDRASIAAAVERSASEHVRWRSGMSGRCCAASTGPLSPPR